jgi:peptidoglycan/xylan/chitin deacetylase (PgdA/CDA1 family)
MAAVREHRLPMAMGDLVAALRAGTLPDNAIGITFDDAYLDNLIHAKPVLEKYEIPATLFVPTGFVGRDEGYWWDELARMILTQPEDWDPESVEALSAFPPQELPEWALRDEPYPHWPTYREVWVAARGQPLEAVRAQVARLRAEIEAPQRGPVDRPMTEAEVREWLAGGLTSIAGHTVTHPVMTQISPEQSRLEIAESVNRCSEIAGGRAVGFAYPYGHWNQDIVPLLREAGVEWACTTRAATISRGEIDYYDLPRLQVMAGMAVPWAG